MLINGGAVASTNITGFANNTVHVDTRRRRRHLQRDLRLDLPGGGIQQVDGDILTIGVDGNGVGTAGMSLTAVQGISSSTTSTLRRHALV